MRQKLTPCDSRLPQLLRAAAMLALMSCSLSWAGDSPDPQLTPGVPSAAVLQSNIHQTICRRGYARSIRPPRQYTERLKRKQIREYRYLDLDPRLYEEDHLIPLSLGGEPTDERNLWPEPRESEWNARRKDELEFVLYKMVCTGRIGLVQAQREMARDWIAAWKRYVPTAPPRWRRSEQ